MVYSLELLAHLASAVLVHQPDALGSGSASQVQQAAVVSLHVLPATSFCCSGCNGLSFHIRMTVSGTIMPFPQTVSTSLAQLHKHDIHECIPLLRAVPDL